MTPTSNQPSVKALSASNRPALPAWKRGMDLICCFLALPFLALLTLAMTVITRLVAPGPVFFRQERLGCNGRRFMIYKFRSMYVGSDTRGHQNYVKELIGTNAPMVKLDARGDSRLIPGSWLLRASGLDELPQIINVLRGEMSVVGPRPCLPAEYAEYQPWQRQRCAAVPGLTGLWQVSGKNRTTFEQMIRLDIRYVETKSWWLDTKIILKTIPALLVQIYDTKAGRQAPVAPSAYTIPPFAMGAAPARSSASPLPPRS
jgi:lipopolysaccharide/colanic/teichoic acid biosynthesis glycosyltransferase